MSRHASWARMSTGIALIGTALFAILAFWPEPRFPSPEETNSRRFLWDRKQLFADLEREFSAARESPSEAVEIGFFAEECEAQRRLSALEAQGKEPSEGTLRALEEVQFRLAALSAAQPKFLSRFRRQSLGFRRRILKAARSWTLPPEDRHEALYRLVLGGRLALEESLAQAGPRNDLTGCESVEDVPSACPCTQIEGIRFCAGDILLSRGDAPASALIARAASFPGAFSHVALVHIPADGAPPVVLESTVNNGTILTPLGAFLKEHRHRLVLLRPRPDAEEMLKDPKLPCRAASRAFALFRSERIPYDFAMNSEDRSELFCAEAVYVAFKDAGMSLWPVRSHIGTRGIIRFYGPLGVRSFVTLTPQDLELDPRLALVAEWRYSGALRKDRIENALIGALLAAAEKGSSLRAPRFVLAESRAIRVASNLQSLLGVQPIVPAGMSASCAARLGGYQKHIYPTLYEAISRKAEQFKREHGYEAPAWILTDLARKALEENRKKLYPFFH